MRQAGSIINAEEARRFAAYLVTQGIAATAEQDRDGSPWSIWVREEDQLPHAREALTLFVSDPQHARYADAEKAAAEKQLEEMKQRSQAQKNVHEVRNNWTGMRVGIGPLTRAVIITCAIIFLLTNWGEDRDSDVFRTLSFVDSKLGIPPLFNVRKGELWRLITPIFLHLGVIHILFNMLMFHSLAGLVEQRRGTLKLATLMLAIALISNFGQAMIPTNLGGSPHFGGMSGVVYGLLGYAWIKSRFEPHLGIRLRGEVVALLVILMFFGWAVGAGPDGKPMADWAHAFGLLSGVVLGYVPIALRGARV